MKNTIALAFGASFALAIGAASAQPQAFETPEAAVDAVIAAIDAGDREAIVTIFGPENEDIILTGDAERDRDNAEDFLASYNAMHRVVVEDDTATLYIGADQWPAPIPIVLGSDGAWRFDPGAAREELAARVIGENELDVLELLRAYVRVQAAYRQIDYDGDGIMEFASTILSDAGQRNGLYWPAEPGVPESPIGEFMARAAASGYAVDGEAVEGDPYLGYYYRILTRQGDAAPGGARDYLVKGAMVAGHAILAFPSAYGETGIMSFMAGENGIVYEADLGEDTLAAAAAIEAFDPADDWRIVD